MKNIYKNVAIAITFLVLGSAVGYTYSKKNKKQINENIPIVKTENSAKSESNSVYKVSNDIIPNVEPFSSNIVIYDSHSTEAYLSGPTIADVCVSINDKLTKDGVQSNFLRVAPSTEYTKSYENSRDLITSKVKGYDKTVLIDIHRNSSTSPQSDPKTILLILDKGNPHYNENKQFADNLFQEIKKSNKVKVDYQFYELKSGFFNQDLSNNSVLVEIGNEKSSSQDIDGCIDELVSAIKVIQNSSAKQKS